MSIRVFITIILTSLLCIAAADAHAGKQKFVRVFADTADEITAAFEAANASGKPTLIKVAPGHYVFLGGFSSEEFGPSGLPYVRGTIVIEGEDAATTVFERASGRYFTVLEGGQLYARNLTVTGGFVPCPSEDCSLNGGGAAANYGGLLSFERCVLTGNSAHNQDGTDWIVGGGAIMNLAGKLRIDRSTLTGNQSIVRGGAISVGGGTAIIRRSIISDNDLRTGPFDFGASFGGGIYVSSAKVVILDSTISGNVLTDVSDEWFSSGGGIYNGGGTVWIQDSAITQNVALPIGQGGGIHNGGEMGIVNSTIGDNTAASAGGGIFNSGHLELQGVTLAANEAQGALLHGPGPCTSFCEQGGGGLWNGPNATAVIATSLIARNTGSPSGQDCFGVLLSKGHNAIGDLAGCVLQPSPEHHGGSLQDLTSLDPLLGELADNGDAGRAHFPLLANSPVIDAGGKVGKRCEKLDQLGHRRRDGDGDGKVRCDIGAIEFRLQN